MEPVRCYVICCVQRTGSWLLAHTLTDTGYAGRPSDYFDEAERQSHTREWQLPGEELSTYVRAMWSRATTPNGVLGSKMMWNDFDRLRSTLETPHVIDAGLEFMGSTFPNAQFVWLRREDKVRQGISWWRAVATNQGLSGQTTGPTNPSSTSGASFLSSSSRSGVRTGGEGGLRRLASSPTRLSTKTSSETG
jgi:LPS sulfotransferase NodH